MSKVWRNLGRKGELSRKTGKKGVSKKLLFWVLKIQTAGGEERWLTNSARSSSWMCLVKLKTE
jgi:hypothetical protein